MSDNKNYYAIIPANVRYDKRLKPLARLLYGEITALTNEKGYCWASNSYFAELYEVSNETISRYISQLKEYGYISLVYEKTNQNIDRRKIFIGGYCQKNQGGIDENVKGVLTEKSRGYCQKNQGGIDENVKENNTVNNIINNTVNGETEKATPPPEKIDFSKINNVASHGNWDLNTFSKCVLIWIHRLTAKTPLELLNILSREEIFRLENNFDKRVSNAGMAIVFAIDDACRGDVRFRLKNFIDCLNINLIELGQLDTRASEGTHMSISMEFFKG